MNETKNATFRLSTYKIDKFTLISPASEPENIELLFDPSGKYFPKRKEFILVIGFRAIYEIDGSNVDIVTANMESVFSFDEEISLESIPPYFYTNSIAIVFPFLRAFIATLTTIANEKQMILPVLNLTTLQDVLRENTVLIESN